MKNLKEWHKIGNKLTSYLEICECQRKLKSIVDNLVSIYDECINANAECRSRNFTGAEWTLLAMLEKYEFVTHGINCEYPIINESHEFWKWIMEVKDSPYLEDN